MYPTSPSPGTYESTVPLAGRQPIDPMALVPVSHSLTCAIAGPHNSDTLSSTQPKAIPPMSNDEQVRQSLDTVLDLLGRDVERHLQAFAQSLHDRAAEAQATAVDDARRAFEAEVERRVTEAVDVARTEWKETARAQSERAFEAEVERRVTEAVDVARTEWNETARAQSERNLDALAAAEGTARASEREATLAGLERLLGAVERLDAAGSLKATLDTLAEGVAAEAARSFVLVVRGSELRAWHTHGFTDAPDLSVVSLPMAEAGQIGEAVTAGKPAQVRGDAFAAPSHPALQFAAATRHEMGLAVPVTLAHRTVAVVYADDGGASNREVPAGWPEVVQLLARHASAHLETLTALKTVTHGEVGASERAATAAARQLAIAPPVADRPGPGAGARAPARELLSPRRFDALRHAYLLLADLKLNHELEVRDGLEHRDLLVRLRDPIDHARALYHERVSADVPWRDEVFDEQLLRTLADGNAEALGPGTESAESA